VLVDLEMMYSEDNAETLRVFDEGADAVIIISGSSRWSWTDGL
jgi:hypothetical protein